MVYPIQTFRKLHPFYLALGELDEVIQHTLLIDIEVIDGRCEDVGLHDLPGSPARFRGRKSDQLLGHSDKCLGQRYEIILQNIRNFILSVCRESLEEI